MTTPIELLTPETMDRFWSQVDKSDDCWLWTGQTRNGYGHFNVRNYLSARMKESA